MPPLKCSSSKCSKSPRFQISSVTDRLKSSGEICRSGERKEGGTFWEDESGTRRRSLGFEYCAVTSLQSHGAQRLTLICLLLPWKRMATDVPDQVRQHMGPIFKKWGARRALLLKRVRICLCEMTLCKYIPAWLSFLICKTKIITLPPWTLRIKWEDI